jgi:hypothetical protein
MDFLRRLLGLAGPDRNRGGTSAGGADGAAPEPHPVDPHRPAVDSPSPAALPCPACAALLDPPPVRNRLCPSCRQPIVVRRLDGKPVLLAEAAVAAFDAERRREIDELAWTAARRRWLHLALNAKAAPAGLESVAAAPLSADVVQAARALYLAAAEKAVKAARRAKRWGDVGRIRREQAEALYLDAGSPVPPPAEIADLHREGMVAVLRSLLPVAKDVELVSAGCCPPCRADDEKTFRITSEVRTPRLPHAGCPKGLCGCDWWPAVAEPRKRRRRASPTARLVASPGTAPEREPERERRGGPGPAPASGPARTTGLAPEREPEREPEPATAPAREPGSDAG